MYKVVKDFFDLQDITSTKGGDVYHAYKVGDNYPREGIEPSDGRIEDLSGSDNLQGEPLIEKVVVKTDKKDSKKDKKDDK